MLVKYTYPIIGDVFLPQHWPFSWDHYRVTWAVEDGRARSVTVAVQTKNLEGLPRITPSAGPGRAADIYIGPQPYQEEVESLVRTACALLGFFAHADVDFERPSIEWEPESEEERKLLHMSHFKVEPGNREEPLPTAFDLVIRCFLAAKENSDKEIALSFMAKGRRDMMAGKYIDAYYSFYFFLETQFWPGHHNTNTVKKKFASASQIRVAMAEARRSATLLQVRVPRLTDLLKLPDETLIHQLVEIRGRLHHHATPHRAGAWHPDKHRAFQAEAELLSCLANAVAQNQNLPLLFDEGLNEQIRAATTKEGIAYTFVVEGQEGGDRRSVVLRLILPTPAPSHSALVAVEEEIRRVGGLFDRHAIRSYSIKSTDGLQVFARYRNNTFER